MIEIVYNDAWLRKHKLHPPAQRKSYKMLRKQLRKPTTCQSHWEDLPTLYPPTSPLSHRLSCRMGSPADKSWEVAFSNISSWASGLEENDVLGSHTADSYVEHFIRHSKARYFGVCEHRFTQDKI